MNTMNEIKFEACLLSVSGKYRISKTTLIRYKCQGSLGILQRSKMRPLTISAVEQKEEALLRWFL